MNFKVELSEKEVIQMITAHMESTGYKVSNVKINVGNEYTGYGTSERQEPTFKSITMDVVKVEEKPTYSSSSHSSLAHQISNIESHAQNEGR
jgi:hypothetical protein